MGDAGFSLVETMVAIALIGTVMAALTPFFAQSLGLTAQQRGKQVAIQVAGDAVERARAVKGSSLLSGRGELRSTQQWADAPARVRPYLDTMTLDWDRMLPVASDAGETAPLPTEPRVVTVNGIDFSQHWYVGRCRQQALAAPGSDRVCEKPDAPDPDASAANVPFFRLVVAVTWPHKDCQDGLCIYVTSTLVSPAGDPVFNLNRPPPTVNDPGPQRGYLTTPVSLQLTAAGGRLPLTWSAIGLPPGLSVSPGGLITGTPTAENVYTVTATVTDRNGDSDTSLAFTWTIGRLPVLTNPGEQVNQAGTAVSLSIAVTGGIGPLVWSVTSLPGGLSINASTGVISGVPTTYGTTVVTVTVTDAGAKTSSVTFTWRILTLTLAGFGPQTTPMDTTVAGLTLTHSGGVAPYTWRATGLPDGLVIDQNTGRISGTAIAGTRYLTTVYVKDSTGDEVSATFVWHVPAVKNNDLRVIAPDPSNPDQTATVGQATSLTATADKGSSSGYSWSAVGLPPGISITGTTRTSATLSGTPTTGSAGVYTVTLVADDSQNKLATLMFTWTVNP
jgi:prepilin-type N-terminal cleavage/methylation domain-containing protein